MFGYGYMMAFTALVAALEFKRRKLRVFDLIYFVYCTPFGFYLHTYLLNQNKAKMNGLPHSNVDDAVHDAGSYLIYMISYSDSNYCYVVVCKETNEACLVDVGDDEEIVSYIKKHPKRFQHLNFTSVLTTHYHHDHSGGNRNIAIHFPNIRIYGSKNERFNNIFATDYVDDGDVVPVGKLQLRVVSTPCHTKGHVMYYLFNAPSKALFSGDCLFSYGVGQFFEGSAEQMYRNIYDKILLLDSDLKSVHLFSGHEYSKENLKFALYLQPTDQAISCKYDELCVLRQKKLPTIPTTLKDEAELNPFCQVNNRAFVNLLKKQAVDIGLAVSEEELGDHSPAQMLGLLRKVKDTSNYSKKME